MNHSLKTFRKTYKLTQAKVAAMLGISKSLVSMVESGQRELPEAALAAFQTLVEEKRNHSAGESPIPVSFDSIREMHASHSMTYLAAYKEDCEHKLQHYGHQWKKWLEKYQREAAKLLVAEKILEAMEHTQPAAPQVTKAKKDLVHALNALVSIIGEKPELLKVKMAGLQQELRTLNGMLSKHNPQENLQAMLPQPEPGSGLH